LGSIPKKKAGTKANEKETGFSAKEAETGVKMTGI